VKVLDLFSGIGGFSLGLERAGMETVAFCEFEPHAQAVLNKHWPKVPIHSDIRSLDGSQYKGTIDVVCGGFPCQDLSTAGKQSGFSGERSSLYVEMLRVISECRPRYAIFENVTGLLTGDSGRWFAKFLYDLAQIGFDAEWHCIEAAYVGAPHRRDRVWIIAYPKRKRQPRQGGLLKSINQKKSDYREADRFINAFQRKALPYVCRGHDGVSEGVDRLARLGNSVLPQITEAIGRAIMNDAKATA
jgi:DNA (cytosine-5)-methyltransferase 1